MMGTYSETEEDSFFDIHAETGSLSELGSDGSDACTRNEISERALGYEFWTQDPESVDERRDRFLKWMGLNSNCDRSDCSDERKTSTDRVRDDNETVLASSDAEGNFFSGRSSQSFESNEALEVEEDAVEDPMYWKIRNLDNGSEFVADKLGKDGMLSRLREVGTNKIFTIEEFTRTLGSSSLVQQFLHRDMKGFSMVNTKTKVRSLLQKLTVGTRHKVTKPETGTQRVRVQTSKKESKELSSLYTGQEFLAHEGSIITMKFSPCGQYLASAGKDGTVRIWRVIEDEMSKNFNVQDIDPSCLYFSLNHFSKLASLNDNGEKINGMKMMRKSSESACVVLPPKLFRIMEKPIHEFRGHTSEVLALSWSKNGYLLSSSVDKTARLWQVGHDKCLGVYPHNNYVTCVEFNPMDDNYFISGSIDGKVRLWEVHSCRVIDWTDVKEIVTALCYSPDGKGGVVGYMDGNCRFYDVVDNHLQMGLQVRKSYCTFLQDLGMRLKVPQVTIATAIIFCHRFFLRQSHSRNDRRTVATVCMFLAGKVEETPRPLKDVILVSYEIIHKKDSEAIQRIKQKEVYEQQKELILSGERVVLATLAFDLNVHHPYKPLVEAIKKFKVAQNALAQVAWNFVNDGLRTSLCLQFKPHHIAAGAIFLAAKFLKVKLPSDGEKVWWQEFDVTPRQLEEVSNQMLELYEQNRVPPQASEAEGSAGGNQRPSGKSSAAQEEHGANNSNSVGGGANTNAGSSNPASSRETPDQPYADNHSGLTRTAQNSNNDYGSAEHNFSDGIGDGEMNDRQTHEREQVSYQGSTAEVQSRSRYGSESNTEDDQEGNTRKSEPRHKGESKEKYHGRALENMDDAVGQSPQEVRKIDKDKVKAAVENKVKAALEKRRKAQGDVTKKTDVMDDDDLIERELEDGIELSAGNEKNKRERKESWSKPSNRPEHENTYHTKLQDEAGDGHHQGSKWKSSRREELDYVEEGELEPYDDADKGYRSPKSNSRKRKAGSPSDKPMEGKRHEYFPDDRNRPGRLDYSERDHKRHMQENHA